MSRESLSRIQECICDLRNALGHSYGAFNSHIKITLSKEIFEKLSLDLLCTTRYGNQDLNKEIVTLYIHGVEVMMEGDA